MNSVKIIYKDNDFISKNCSAPISLLGTFLTCDQGCGNSPIKRYIVDSVSLDGVMNATGIKTSDQYVTLYDPFIDENEKVEITILKQSFIHILDEWEKICKEKPQEVVITREGDQFFFEKKF